MCKGSLNHCLYQLKKKPEEHIDDIKRSLDYADKLGIGVNLYLEDWSNGMKNSPAFVYQMVDVLRDTNIKRFMLPDTLGILNPLDVIEFMRKMVKRYRDLHFDFHEGEYPVLCDQSPCLHRMRQKIRNIKLYEPAEFIYTFLRDRLKFNPIEEPIAVHITCSMRLMGLGDTLIALAKLCSTNVFVPEEVGCCGFAGDKGFTHPELNAYALRKLGPQIKQKGIRIGYSNSRTCEIGLQTNAGIPYVSIVYLVDRCTLGLKK